MYILSVDFGTSSVKTSVLNKMNNVVLFSKEEYDYKVIDKDKVELDPTIMFNCFVKSMESLDQYKKDIEAVAYCTFSPSLVVMDKDGDELYPVITHLDRRSRKQSASIIEVMGKDAFKSITGVLPFSGGVSLTSLLWIKENLPDIFNKTYMIGHLNTYVYKKLTGCWATDPTNASMIGLYETVRLKGWSQDICHTFNIPMHILPEIHTAGTIIGKLTRKAADLTGLKQGIPVVLGSNDAATAQIGADNVNSGDILNISGSSEMISIITDRPEVNDRYYLRNAITPGMWQIYATTIGGFALEWFRKEFYREIDQNSFYCKYLPEALNHCTEKSTIKFLPYLAGDRHSLRKKRGVFSGLTLDSTREDMLAAILRGIQEPIDKTIKLSRRFMELSGTLKITGGLAGEAYINYKRLAFKEFEIKVIENCPTLGNGKLAWDSLNNC